MSKEITSQEKIERIKENGTFHYAEPWKLNACVGFNGDTGIFTYEFGYKEAACILIEKAKDEKYNYIDALIYPLVFCARHYLELFLKRTLLSLMRIYQLQGKESPVTEDKIFSYHNLQTLWNSIIEMPIIDDKEYSKTIKRCTPLLRDFYEQDSNSEAFRYPVSKKSDKYLETLSHINVLDFEKQFEKLYDQFDHLDIIISLYLETAEELWS